MRERKRLGFKELTALEELVAGEKSSGRHRPLNYFLHQARDGPREFAVDRAWLQLTDVDSGGVRDSLGVVEDLQGINGFPWST